MNSVGLVYTFVTEYLGFAGFGDEGKVMALAAYGEDTYVERFRDVIRPTPDGGYAVNMAYFSYDTFGQLRPFKRKFIDTFGPPRARGEPITDRHRDVAFALQAVTEEIVLHRVRTLLKKHPGVRDLCLSGGVALNCVANAKILEQTDVRRLWVPPCASDTGRAARQRAVALPPRPRAPARLRAEARPLRQGLRRGGDRARARWRPGCAIAAWARPSSWRAWREDLADGKIVGWFQGRFEMGPRALGNRSILADPRRPEMRDVLNAKVKQREPFRPFAPAVLVERAAEFFEIDQPDPFMTLAPRVRPESRDRIPAAVHVDGTGRIQTVERVVEPALLRPDRGVRAAHGRAHPAQHQLQPLRADRRLAPGTPSSATCKSGMDVLVLGDFYTSDRPARRSGPRRRARRAGAGARGPGGGGADGQGHAELGGFVPAMDLWLTRRRGRGGHDGAYAAALFGRPKPWAKAYNISDGRRRGAPDPPGQPHAAACCVGYHRTAASSAIGLATGSLRRACSLGMTTAQRTPSGANSSSTVPPSS